MHNTGTIIYKYNIKHDRVNFMKIKIKNTTYF